VGTLTLAFADVAALKGFFDDHLSKGRAYVAGGEGVTERDACELILEHRGKTHRLVGEVVHVRAEDPGRGVGLQLARLDANAAKALKTFVDTASDLDEPSPEPTREGGEAFDEEGSDASPGTIQRLHDRIRSLSVPEQLRLAASGTLGERTALERMHGPAVWESLLRNARMTVPEVARIARKGSLPRPLIDLIAANAPWVAAGEVQRALLSNPRSSPAVVMKVLGAMSRHDLMMVPQQTAYPEPVRAAAKKRLGR
jgi:hypothetical protein